MTRLKWAPDTEKIIGNEKFNSYMQRTRLIVLAVIAVALFISTAYVLLSQQPTAQPLNEMGYRDITSNDFNVMLANKDFLLINVHIPYAGQIRGTDLFIPYNQISQSIDQLPVDKDSKIVVYCRSGSMSTTSSEELVRLGYTNILNLREGMIGWEQSGYSIVKQQ